MTPEQITAVGEAVLGTAVGVAFLLLIYGVFVKERNKR